MGRDFEGSGQYDVTAERQQMPETALGRGAIGGQRAGATRGYGDGPVATRQPLGVALSGAIERQQDVAQRLAQCAIELSQRLTGGLPSAPDNPNKTISRDPNGAIERATTQIDATIALENLQHIHAELG